ncbi:MAG: FO synthase subunit 2 [Promethearchaeota archaeon]|nr:MAG: FO synthase subunit 2 [Candidatus Lokiarchaeota archaeon]
MEIKNYKNIDPKIKEILSKALKEGTEITNEEALKLLEVTGKEFLALQDTADSICQQKKDNIVTFVINRNINFTNVCYQGCKFCSFSVKEEEQNSFLLEVEEIRKKVKEANKKGCSEVCIQGGINPKLTYEYYLNILKAVKGVNPKIHIHAFSPQEIKQISRLKKDSIKNTLKELKNAGLDSIPGTAAEILVDRIRKIICPNKISTEEWKEIVMIAHQLDIPTTSTMMYGHIESLEDRIKHLEVLRETQKKTNGITEFVPLPYVEKNPILSQHQEYRLNYTSGMDDLKLISVARIYLKDYIDNIQCSWVKLGKRLAQVSLNSGANDFSGTLMEENISKSAGAKYGEFLSPEEIVKIIKNAAKRPAQRDTVYNILKYY